MKAPEHTEVHKGDVTTTVQYLQEGSKNTRYFGKGKEVNIGKYDDVSVIMHDARPNREEYTLENGGFALVQHESTVTEWNSREQLNTIYPGEIAELVKSMTGADDVVVVSPPVLRKTQAEVGSGHQPRAADVHTDWSPGNAEETAKRHAEKDAAFSQYSRCIFVNVWRALSPPPQDWPLAVIDARTVGADEGSPYRMIIVDKIPETLPMVPEPYSFIEGANFNYKPEHKWCYFSDMKIDEVLAFKLYDSDRHNGSQSWRCPHTAFLNPAEGSSPRESVEVRTICYFK